MTGIFSVGCNRVQSSCRYTDDMSDTVVVNVVQGALRGRIATSKSGGSYFSFQGIPYAKSPVGSLRFKAPEAPEPWTGVRDALKEGNVSFQFNLITNANVGDEDCLFLNVYSPKVPSKGVASESKLAVMVWIHGGAFVMGSGNSDVYSPDYLVDQGVVVVTFNYRLGPLGFLSTEDGEIPGNAGLKDQVAALRWVNQNIARFGGDPDNVTIFGESAGGASVHYQLLSPMSKGLFQRAISQSGSALNLWAFSHAGRSRTLRLARALGCKSDLSRDVLEFLRDIPADKLLNSQLLSMTDEEKRRDPELMVPFVPTSEQMVIGVAEKFLPACPIDIIQSGTFNMVPYITGVNTNEGMISMKAFFGDKDPSLKVENDFESLLPKDLFSQIDTAISREAAQQVKQYYFGDKTLCEETHQEYTDLKSDLLFVYTINKTVELQALRSSAPLYYYQFCFDGKLGHLKKMFNAQHLKGVSHGDDLGYLFHMPMFPCEVDADSPEMRVLNMVVKMWTNFAKTGNPSPPDIAWEPVTPAKRCYLMIDEVPAMLEDVEKERMAFWDELYKKYKGSQKT